MRISITLVKEGKSNRLYSKQILLFIHSLYINVIDLYSPSNCHLDSFWSYISLGSP
jgi:hypothetical protein